ncbi:YafY family transcriptional regulator [Luteibacter anthropi]|uniref:YafY family transcriptional regulator n=2 Tax=Luteibacter anthropi TaxID=564369 RepID=A0A7X5ZHP4_9GAMM|nr:YafY family transcriptional regulator [Luteibacter anthropi]
MSRSERLLDLLQVLRRRKRPISGQKLAADMGISLRTLYRDIASLQAQGAPIEGEAGIGYVLRPGFMLPPLMFGSAELDALVLGMRLVLDRGDPDLAKGAENTLAKIAAVLPPDLRQELESSALLVGNSLKAPADTIDARVLRDALRLERKIEITYEGPDGRQSRRVVWPFAIAYFRQSHVLMCWCEWRDDFRSFRTDRITSVALLGDRYPRRKQALLKAWRQTDDVAGKTILSETDTDWT